MRVFTIIGIVFAVVGAYFGWVALQPSKGPLDDSSAPILALVFLPMGIVFTLVGLYVSRLTGNRDKLMREGIPGQAVIQTVAETGVYINERPMARMSLLVTVPGRAPYSVEHSEVIPLIALGMITPGSSLPVAVDPSDPQKLAIDWSGETRARAMAASGMTVAYPQMQASPGTPMPNTLSGSAANTLSSSPQLGSVPTLGAALGGGGVGFGMPMAIAGGQGAPVFSFGGTKIDLSGIYQQLAQAGVTITGGMPMAFSGGSTIIDARPGDAEAHLAQLKSAGDSGRATISAAQGMGIAIHGNQLMTLDMNVTPSSGVAYPAHVTALVPPTAASRAVAGGTLQVYIDHANPQNLAVDWDAA